MRDRNEGRDLNATLYIKEGRAEVVLTQRDTGERVGVHTFETMDKALEWLTVMKWDYKVAA